MKRLFFSVCLLTTVAIVSAQKPYKDKKVDINYNEYMSHGGFGFMYHEDRSLENFVAFQNYTDDYLEVHFKVPQIGVDTTYIVSPNQYWGESFHLGWNLISSEYSELKPLMVECTVNQPGYNFTIRYIWCRGIKKYQ